jgi:sensor histidine kinase YesM
LLDIVICLPPASWLLIDVYAHLLPPTLLNFSWFSYNIEFIDLILPSRSLLALFFVRLFSSSHFCRIIALYRPLFLLSFPSTLFVLLFSCFFLPLFGYLLASLTVSLSIVNFDQLVLIFSPSAFICDVYLFPYSFLSLSSISSIMTDISLSGSSLYLCIFLTVLLNRSFFIYMSLIYLAAICRLIPLSVSPPPSLSLNARLLIPSVALIFLTM